MPGKRKDRSEDVVKAKFESAAANNEEDLREFLSAFEKPTQIYRYLRTRNMISPIFLHRTLSYMNHRKSRKQSSSRRKFRIDDLLSQKMKKLDGSIAFPNDYMILLFSGFFDYSLTDDVRNLVQVETILLKISHKKRKDNLSDMSHTVLGVMNIEINPKDNKIGYPVVNIPIESFKPLSCPSQTYMLVFKVQTFPFNLNNANGGADDSLSYKRFKANTKLFASELIVFDKSGRCLLTEGEYSLTLDEIHHIRLPSTKVTRWETLPESALDSAFNSFETFEKSPTLKFRLMWSKKPSPVIVDTLPPFNTTGDADSKKFLNKNAEAERRQEICYQFIHNSNYRQQTEPTVEYICPWCSLNCCQLYSLLKHLKLCHDRFTFIYVPQPNCSFINVTVNNMYDGSYTIDLHQSGFTFSRICPVRRNVVTHLVVFRPRRPKPSLLEFIEIDDNELNNQRPFLIGHNRLYHHTMTYLPVHPKELDNDSEAENDPTWLQRKTLMMIDDFTDVNNGEKEVMKMWNLHVMKFVFVGDCQIPIACEMFVDFKGRELLEKKLYRNVLLHMCSLFDYGLLSAEDLYKVMVKFQKILSESPAAKQAMTDNVNAQLSHWLNVGIYKPQNHQEPLPGYCKRGKSSFT